MQRFFYAGYFVFKFGVGKKGFHTINNLVVCNWRGEIIYMDAGEAGSVHDRTMFTNSDLYLQEDRFFKSTSSIRQYLLGDPGYRGDGPVYVPATHSALASDIDGTIRKRDKMLRYQRVLIERVFGLLKERWEQLDNRATAETTTDVFYASCLLYNFECRRNNSWPRDTRYLMNNCMDPDIPFDTFVDVDRQLDE